MSPTTLKLECFGVGGGGLVNFFKLSIFANVCLPNLIKTTVNADRRSSGRLHVVNKLLLTRFLPCTDRFI